MRDDDLRAVCFLALDALPYDDEETEDGFLYAYRAGSIDIADKRALLAAHDNEVYVWPRLLDDDDGPMLDLLKSFHGARIQVPARRSARPDPERLALRFERFEAV